MRDLVASEIRRLHKKVAAADRRIALTLLPGKVRQKDAEKRRIRLQIGETSDGTPILGPWVRWQEATNGTSRFHAEPDMDEQMMMWSQSGTVGDASMAVPGTYDKDHDAPSTSSSEAVWDCGSGRIELGPLGVLIRGNVYIEDRVHVREGLRADGGVFSPRGVWPPVPVVVPPVR